MTIVQALERLRQEDHFQASGSLGYLASFYSPKSKHKVTEAGPSPLLYQVTKPGRHGQERGPLTHNLQPEARKCFISEKTGMQKSLRGPVRCSSALFTTTGLGFLCASICQIVRSAPTSVKFSGSSLWSQLCHVNLLWIKWVLVTDITLSGEGGALPPLQEGTWHDVLCPSELGVRSYRNSLQLQRDTAKTWHDTRKCK